MSEKLKVLITVKTYPHPSESYRELVYTAGVLEDGTFIRLYPIDYRYRPDDQQFQKHQWIEVIAEKNTGDPRPESYRPVQGKPILCVGKPINARNNWRERKRFVLAKGTQAMCDLLKEPREGGRSLGIVKPLRVMDFVVEEDERDWKPQWKRLFKQKNLFGLDQKPLEKIPYKFSYRFQCEAPDCRGHKMMIADWEIGELYRKMRDATGDENAAVQKVKGKYFDQICGADRDTHFFVGTVLSFGTWIILGIFWPKKELQRPTTGEIRWPDR